MRPHNSPDTKQSSFRIILANATIILLSIVVGLSVAGAFMGTSRAHAFFSSIWMGSVWIGICLITTISFFAIPRLRKNTGLFLVHAGVIMIIAGAIIGSEFGHRWSTAFGMQKRLIKGMLELEERHLVNTVHTSSGEIKLPFAINLRSFRLEYYPPELMLALFVRNKTGDKEFSIPFDPQSQDELELAETGITVSAKKFLKNARSVGNSGDGMGTITINNREGVLKTLSVEAGRTWTDNDQHMEFMVDQVFSNFRRDPKGGFKNLPGLALNPAVIVKVTYNDKTSKVLLFENLPRMPMGNMNVSDGLDLKDLGIELVYTRPRNPGFAAAAKGPAAVLLKFKYADQEIEQWVVGGSTGSGYLIVHLDDKFGLDYVVKLNPVMNMIVKDYISVIDVIQDGKVVASKKLEVNHPLHYGGYHFYQSSYDPHNLQTSILSIVSDRGWLFPILPGLLITIIGVCIECLGSFVRQIRIHKQTAGLSIKPSAMPDCWTRRILISGAGLSFVGVIIALGIRISRGLETVQIFMGFSLVMMMLSFLLYGFNATSWARRVYASGFCFSFTAYIIRWAGTGHAPLQHMFEVMLTLGTFWFPLMLFLKRMLDIRGDRFDPLLNAIIIFPAVFIFDPFVRPLPPALQSGYFIPHVCAYLLGYVLLAKAFGLSFYAWTINKREPELSDKVRQDAHAVILLGLPLMTIGLILGALWAKAAWGTFWGWDPKEMWSLASWLLFVTYYHYHCKRNRSNTLENLLVGLGFLAVIITLTWVNLSRIFAGLHNYG